MCCVCRCRSVVMPVIRDFGPDLILVSAGFNSTSGHPSTLGGYSVTPKCEFIIIDAKLLQLVQ